MVEPYPSEKYELVSWDDDIPNIWKNVPNHQPDSKWERNQHSNLTDFYGNLEDSPMEIQQGFPAI